MATAAHLKGGQVAKASGRRNQQNRPQAPQAPASPASKTPTLWSVVNMPSGAASTHAGGEAMTASPDLGEEDDDEPFHEFNWHRMQQCGVGEPSEPSAKSPAMLMERPEPRMADNQMASAMQVKNHG